MHLPISGVLIAAAVLILFVLPHLSLGALFVIAAVAVTWFPAYSHFSSALFVIGVLLILWKGIFSR